MYLFILLGTRGADGATPVDQGGGAGRVLLQIFNNKFCRKRLRSSVTRGIMRSNKKTP